MKKLIACITLLFCVAAISPCVLALDKDDGFIIKDYNVNAVLHENNTITQTETILVDFLESRHGIFRAFPTTVYVERQTPDGLITLPYRMKVRNVQVQGEEYDQSTEDGVHLIRIGNEDTTHMGEVEYSLSFTVDVGDDRTPDSDSIFYSLLGADVTTTVEHCAFNFTFDKPLPSGTELSMFSGAYGALDGNDKINFTQDEYGIYGETIVPLEAGEAITAYAQLPEGYFVGERKYSATFGYILAAITAVLAIAFIVYSFNVRHKKPVVTVEFYPPDGISSAEVGYIIDGSANDEDLLSLILYLAGKGYCTVSGEGEDMTITKIKDLTDAPQYMLTFFNALFEKGDICVLKEHGNDFYNKLQGAKCLLGSEFQGKRKLYDTASETFAVLSPFFLSLMFFVSVLNFTALLSPAPMIIAIFTSLCIFGAAIVTYFASRQWTFASLGAKAAFSVGIGAFSAFGLGLAVLCDYLVSTLYIVPAWTVLILFGITLLGALCISRTGKPSTYFTEISGKLLGLKNFIQKAELPRIERLAKENPSYFYDVLPYAYVFKLSDEWVKQFETLALPPPTWYVGNDMTLFNMYWLSRSLNHSYSSMMQGITAANMKSGGSGGASFGGGGGFSGGGFGGGGTGSW